MNYLSEEYRQVLLNSRLAQEPGAVLSIVDILGVQRRRYDDFFQWSRLEKSEPLSNSGLHKVLSDMFPVKIQGGDIQIHYHSYGMDPIPRDPETCCRRHCTYGVPLFLRLTLQALVDVSWQSDFDQGRYYLNYPKAGMDVVPFLTDNCTLLIRSRSEKSAPVERCPVGNLGLIDPDMKDLEHKYHLNNIRLFFLSDYLERQIRFALRRMQANFDNRDHRDKLLSPIDAARLLGRAIGAEIYACVIDSRMCPELPAGKPLASVSIRHQAGHSGPFGVHGKRAGSERRQVHLSHYSRLCPLETPESEAIGLSLHLARGVAVGEDGTLWARYDGGRRSPAEEEAGAVGSYYDKDQERETVLARKEGVIQPVDWKDISFWENTSGQMLSTASTLIPFIHHNDPTRATMGAKNMKQALPLLNPEPPLVKTGLEVNVGRESRQCLIAPKCG